MDNNQNNHVKAQYAIVGRRRKVADMLAQSFREEEIAEQLNVAQVTVARDVKFLKEAAQKFVFDLARSDLAYFYKSSLAGVEAAKRRAWDIANRPDVEDKIALAALRLAKDCDVARFELYQNGPSILNVKALNDRVVEIEERQHNNNGSSGSNQNQEPFRTA